tara:strand:- start:667 stop:1410 length:744 start_codon:yes stop_codon:yes gene_type:complete
MKQQLYINTFNKDNKYFDQVETILNYSPEKIKEIKKYKLKTRFLKNANSKLGRNIYAFDLPAVVSCPNYKECFKTCYANKGAFIWKSAKNSNTYNFAIALHDLEFLKRELIKDIKKKKIKNIRIHSSGDFYSKQYFLMWVQIARMFPNLNLFAYTKADEIDKIETPSNFNIIKSFIKVDNKKYLNYGAFDYVKKLSRASKGLICPPTKGAYLTNTEGKTPNNTKLKNITCSLCKYCITKNKPVFVQH